MYGAAPPLFEDENYSRKLWLGSIFRYIQSRTKLVTVTAAYTVASDVGFVRVDCTGGAITVTIPAAANWIGRRIIIKKIDSSGNAVTVARTGSDTFDGMTSMTLPAQYNRVGIIAAASATWDIAS